MNRFVRASAMSVICTMGAIAVGQAQTATCENAQYDPDVLARFPNIAKACSDIISKNGEDYAVVTARLDRVDPSGRVQVRVKQADGSYSKQMSIRPRPDLRVLVDGKPARVQDLAANQEITAYVKVREPEMALAPADSAQTFVFTPIEEPQQPQQQMAALPATAGILPLFGLLGGMSLLLGGWLSVMRHRRH
jgi:hypothetical protein